MYQRSSPPSEGSQNGVGSDSIALRQTGRMTAHLQELFSSFQGEGPYVGERQIFVRFFGCHLDCAFCDTPETKSVLKPRGFAPKTFRMEASPGTWRFEQLPNPVTPERASALIERLNTCPHHSVAITGGEPLLQMRFLRELLPRLRADGHRTYLETAGDLHRALAQLMEWLDFIAMDIKMPSVTHDRALWDEHEQFLEIAAAKEVFCKAVVGAETTDEEIECAAGLIATTAPESLLVLQPVTPCGEVKETATPAQLLGWQALAKQFIPNVRVIPQCHKIARAL